MFLPECCMFGSIEQKAATPAFSYRYFAQKAGYNSSGMYKDIVRGRTNIQPSFIAKLSKAMRHGRREEEYFENMVLFNQAKGVDEKKKYFERMMRFYNSKAYLVDSSQYEFYSKWYYSAIRDLLEVIDIKDDYQKLARSLNPTIRPEQSKKAIDILLELGMIKKNARKRGLWGEKKKILFLWKKDKMGDGFYQLNLQLFPLSKIP